MLHLTATSAVAVLLLLLVGCSRDTGTKTATAMQHRLELEIPAGTSVADAEARLKQQGFTVWRETDASWGDREQVSYLYGDLSEGGIVKRRWQVAVFHENDAVTGIDVATGRVGP